MINEFGIEWVFLDDGGWVVMMVAECRVIVGSDRLWVCEREGQ